MVRFLERKAAVKASLEALSVEKLKKCIPAGVSRNIAHTEEALADYLATAVATFHGAPRVVVPSAVLGHLDENARAR